MQVVAATAVVLAAFVGWLSQLLGLPGNWLILAAVGVYALVYHGPGRLDVGLETFVVLAVLAVLGEVIEFVAAAFGVSKAGGSRRGAFLALVGSLVGGVVGFFVGVPVPVVGPLIAALVFGGLGALVGAVVGESWHGHDLDTSLQIGQAAFVGRVLGTLGKLIVGAVMIVVTIVALVV